MEVCSGLCSVQRLSLGRDHMRAYEKMKGRLLYANEGLSRKSHSCICFVGNPLVLHNSVVS